MLDISQYNADIARILQGQEQQVSTRRHAGTQKSALRAVYQENRLASVDRSELSQAAQSTGSFKFDFESSVSVEWSGSYSFESGPPATFESSFSFAMTITETMRVEFGAGTEIGEDQISGTDFTFDRDGMLTMLDELLEKVSAGERTQVDLGGELDGQVINLLQQLGLIDDDGQATPLLQLLSDYAGLGRFQTGQEVNTAAKLSYGSMLNSTQLGWQGWQQQLAGNADPADAAAAVGVTGGTNAVTNSMIGGDVTIDDRDVININITQDE